MKLQTRIIADLALSRSGFLTLSLTERGALEKAEAITLGIANIFRDDAEREERRHGNNRFHHRSIRHARAAT